MSIWFVALLSSGPCSCPLPPPPSWPWVPSRQKSGSSGCSSGPGGRRGQVGSNALPVSPPSSQMDSSLEASVEIFPFSQGMLQTRRGRVTPTPPPEVFLLESTPPQAQPLGLPSHSAPPGAGLFDCCCGLAETLAGAHGEGVQSPLIVISIPVPPLPFLLSDLGWPLPFSEIVQ